MRSSSYSNIFYFFVATAIFLLYNIIGIIYNQRKRGIYGTDAIPHIEMWRKLPG
jgi:hypothetical protein